MNYFNFNIQASVSYTHLDVYKRQTLPIEKTFCFGLLLSHGIGIHEIKYIDLLEFLQ